MRIGYEQFNLYLFFVFFSPCSQFLHQVVDVACGREQIFETFGTAYVIAPLVEALKETILLASGQKWSRNFVSI